VKPTNISCLCVCINEKQKDAWRIKVLTRSTHALYTLFIVSCPVGAVQTCVTLYRPTCTVFKRTRNSLKRAPLVGKVKGGTTGCGNVSSLQRALCKIAYNFEVRVFVVKTFYQTSSLELQVYRLVSKVYKLCFNIVFRVKGGHRKSSKRWDLWIGYFG
jgi:hypothetical protein